MSAQVAAAFGRAAAERRAALVGYLPAGFPSVPGAIAALTGTRYEPANVHVGPPTGPLRKITDTRPELHGVTLGRQQPLAYRAADGLELDGLLVLPVGRSASDGPFPLVTIVHGGPYDRYADGWQLFWFPSGIFTGLAA